MNGALETDILKAETDRNGALCALTHKRTGTSFLRDGGGEAWRMTVAGPGRDPVVVGSAGQSPSNEEDRNGRTMTWNSVAVGGKPVTIRVETHVEAQGESLCWWARISNKSDLVVESFEFPILAGVLLDAAALYRPRGLGERIEAPQAQEKIEDLQYPAASMQWFDYASSSEGLYFGSHDASFHTTGMATRPEGGRLRLSFTKHPFLKPGEAWESAPFVTALHAGDWHAGARIYRTWADSWLRHEAPPRWVEENQGWYLVILKQQNGAVMWKYKDLPAMLEFAQRSGIGTVGAFGWGIGGHDHLYPDYAVAPELGTVEDLKAAIRAVKANGGRVILYTNGQLIDTTGEYFQGMGRRIAAKDRQGKEHFELWHKFSDHSGYRHAIACQSVPQWGDKLLELALYVEGLGADGIIFDQIGGASHGHLCFDAAHGHRSPAEAMGPGIVRNLARVRAALKAKNPDFCLIVEHAGDAMCQHVDWIHGAGFGYYETANGFPALFRYAFPEYRFTNRAIGPAPFLSYREANYAVAYGMGIDLECRYPADVPLVREGKRPRPEDYGNVKSPPTMDIVVTGPVEAYRDYLARALAIRAAHPVLQRGTFRDGEGIGALPAGVIGKRYDLGDETAVIVWNAGERERDVRPEVGGMEPVKVLHPEAGKSGTKLAAERIAFHFFRRTL